MKIYIYVAKGSIVKCCMSKRNQARNNFLKFWSYKVNNITYSLDYNRPPTMFLYLSAEHPSADYQNKNFEHGNLTPPM